MSRLLGLSRRELAVLAAAFLLSLPAVTPRIYASDEIQYFSYLRSIWFDHDVSFDNEYRYFYEHDIGRGENFHATFLELTTGTGRRPNFGTIGAALLWAPFYAAGNAIARATGAIADGYSLPYVAAVAYASAFYGFAAVVLSAAAARLLRRGSPDVRAIGSTDASAHGIGTEVVAAVLIWIGTPLLFYMYVAPPYAHACSAFAVALFVFVWLRVRRTWPIGGAIALGLSGALMAMVREQDLFVALGPAVDLAVTALRTPGTVRSSYLRAAAAGCVAFAAGVTPQLLAYGALNGYPGPSKLVARKMSWHSPHALHVLGSPEHGFLFWTPLALLAIAGLVLLAWRARGDLRLAGGCLLLMLALQVYVSGSVESWTVAGAFGQRRFVGVTSVLTIGLAILLVTVPRGLGRVALGAAIALCVWWNLGLTAAFGTGLMNRQRLELARNAHDVFVTVPRLAPELAMRYLTRRESFYRTE
jgi:uncharacterized membrane protein YbaN (DUF454 family)